MKVYVIAHNGGYDGYSAPIQAFDDIEDAKRALSSMEPIEENYSSCFELFEVPLWPKLQELSMNQIKPVAEGKSR